MKNKDEQTGLVGLAIGAAVIGWFLPRNQSIATALLMSWSGSAGRKAMV